MMWSSQKDLPTGLWHVGRSGIKHQGRLLTNLKRAGKSEGREFVEQGVLKGQQLNEEIQTEAEISF